MNSETTSARITIPDPGKNLKFSRDDEVELMFLYACSFGSVSPGASPELRDGSITALLK